MIEQRSEEWYRQRLGKVTASRVKDVMAKTKTGPSKSRENYMMELLCQRLTGVVEEGFSSAAMQRGTELEPMARGMYEGERGVLVMECGFVDHPEIAGCGASPDGLVGDDGLIEIKCPNTAQHVEFLRFKEIPSPYQMQMMLQMMCTGRQWCDFVSFDDRLPQELQFACKRFIRAEQQELEQAIEAEVKKFIVELDNLEQELREAMKGDRA